MGWAQCWKMPVQAATYRQAEYVMGSVFEITLDTSETLSEAEQSAFFLPLFAQLRHQDQVLSHYRPDSELMTVVAALRQPKASPQKLSTDLCYALKQARFYHQVTGGSFDITVGPLVERWGFKSHQFRVPSPEEIADGLRYTGFRQTDFDAQHCVLSGVAPVNNPLDFGALGKGIAIDRAVAYFRDHLHADYPQTQGLAIQGGGSSAYFWGAPEATPQGWPVISRWGDHQVYWLKNQGLGVSGIDQNFGVYQGQRYGHILNPLTGEAIRAEQIQGDQVYVVAETAEMADVFSTALWVGSPEQASRWSDRFRFQFWWVAPSPVHYPAGESSSGD